jgi:hypothetical protein
MAGVSLAISPGTLQVDMAIGLEESVGLISSAAADEMGMSFDGEAGVAINLTNDAGVSDIPSSAPPMQLNIPIFSSPLRLAGEDSSLVVFFRRAASSDSCSERIFPPSTFEKQGNAIAIGVRRFGAYQPLWVPTKELEQKLGDATDADGSFVIERQGCRVVTKAEERKMPKASISELRIEKEGTRVRFSADVTGGGLKGCYFFARDIISEETHKRNGDRPEFEFDFSNQTGSIDARVMIGCNFESGRTLETKPKAFQMGLSPERIWLSHSFKTETHLQIETDVDEESVDSCFVEITEGASSVGINEVASSGTGCDNSGTQSCSRTFYMDNPSIFDFHEFLKGSENNGFPMNMQVICTGLNGNQVKSNTVKFYDKKPPMDVYAEEHVVSYSDSNSVLMLNLDIRSAGLDSTYTTYIVYIVVCDENQENSCTSLTGGTVDVDEGCNNTWCSIDVSDFGLNNTNIFSPGKDYFISSLEIYTADGEDLLISLSTDQHRSFYRDGGGNVKARVVRFSVEEDSGWFLRDPLPSVNSGSPVTVSYIFTLSTTNGVQETLKKISEICWSADIGGVHDYGCQSNPGFDTSNRYTYPTSFGDANVSFHWVKIRFENDAYAPITWYAQ